MNATILTLINREESYQPDILSTELYMNSTQGGMLSKSMRNRYLSIMSSHCKNQTSIARALNIFDLYLSNERELYKNLKVITLTCCILASKLENVQSNILSPTRIKNLRLKRTVLLFERKILASINFTFSPTIYEMTYELILACVPIKKHPYFFSGTSTNTMRLDIFYNYCLAYEVLEFPKLIVAVTIVLEILGSNENSVQSQNDFILSLSLISNLTSDRHIQVERCTNKLRKHLRLVETSTLNTPKKKVEQNQANANTPDTVTIQRRPIITPTKTSRRKTKSRSRAQKRDDDDDDDDELNWKEMCSIA